MLGQSAATASTFYVNKRRGERLRSWGSANAETRVIFVSQKVLRILLPALCFLLRFQIQGGLSHLSVADRGESLLGFENDVPFSSWGEKLSATAQVGWGARHSASSPASTRPPFASSKKQLHRAFVENISGVAILRLLFQLTPPRPGRRLQKLPSHPGAQSCDKWANPGGWGAAPPATRTERAPVHPRSGN